MKSFDRKEYNKEHYIKNKKLYIFRQKAKRGSLKDYDFDEIYDFFLHVNRPLKNPERSKKIKKKVA